MKDDKQDQTEENLSFENEISKLRMTAELGANFMGTNSELPPEVEKQWLDNIWQFEKLHKEAKQTTVYKFIGEPAYTKIEDLNEDEIPGALEKILGQMGENGIGLDTICPVEDRELYRFITEELFQLEKDDMRMPGWVTHYTYEDFHPCHDRDITEHSKDFMGCLLDKDDTYIRTFLAPVHCKSRNEEDIFNPGQEKIRLFREAFNSFELKKFEFIGLERTDAVATAEFDIEYNATEGQNKMVFSGKAILGLIYEYDFWCVNTCIMPGFIL